MKHVRFATLSLGLALSVVGSYACSDGDGDTSTGGPVCPDGDATQKPFRGEWKTVVDAPFTAADISTISIGRLEQEENWGNKGDVLIEFDLPAGSNNIQIETRPYTHAECEADAEQIFDNMYLWAATTSTPTVFKDLDADETCIALKEERGDVLPDPDNTVAWQDGCYVYHYYDGQAAPQRSGADIRVHLPVDYMGEVNAITDDNTVEDDYPLRGDIIVNGLCNGGSFTLSNGAAEIKMCDNLSIAPNCSQDQINTCEMMGWSITCGCDIFGQLEVKANPATGPDITIDFPNDLWIYAKFDNEQTGAVAGSPTSCDATIANCTADTCAIDQSPETPWKGTVTYNFPGDMATQGAGYAISTTAERCQAVPEVEKPGDWMQGVAPEGDRRGFTTLCTGCL